jgi:hypothetical protein
MQTGASRLIAACASLLAVSPAFAQQKRDGPPIATTVYVNFANGSTNFRPTEASVAALSAAAEATLVTIGGRTSTEKPTARSYLVANGVSPVRINLNYLSVEDFIADNQTADGRQVNQRVEVELIYVPELQATEQKYQAAVKKRMQAMTAPCPSTLCT